VLLHGFTNALVSDIRRPLQGRQGELNAAKNNFAGSQPQTERGFKAAGHVTDGVGGQRMGTKRLDMKLGLLQVNEEKGGRDA
jgi:hypothetical protein